MAARHSLSQAKGQDELTDRVLDAALTEFMDRGIKGSSIESVAKRLGVDRSVVSRRFDKNELAKAVMIREASRYLASIGQGITGKTLRARVEEGFVAGVARRREQYILDALLKHDPVSAMTYIVGPEAGGLLEYAINITRHALQQAPDSFKYTRASLDAAAIAMIRLSHSFSSAPPDTGMDDYYLRGIARNVLLPILMPRAGRQSSTNARNLSTAASQRRDNSAK